MERTSEILNELKTISPFLANMEKVNVFEVPGDYFNLLEKKITTNVLLAENKKNEIHNVPEGYFEGLSNKILLAIKSTEDANDETNLSSVLFSLKDKSTLTVPEYYFENLSDAIFTKIKAKKTKVISINSSTRWWRYAAAAIIAGIITIGSLQIFNKKYANDNAGQISFASNNIPDYIKLSFQYKTPQQIDNGIASLSDADIVNYLQQHGSVLDDDLITNNIDTTGLPDATDYLINDNTLDNFLKVDNTMPRTNNN